MMRFPAHTGCATCLACDLHKDRNPLVLTTNGFHDSGAMGNRTPDLCIANATLYQLSYSPVQQGISYTRPRYGHQTGCGACLPAPGLHHGTSADSSRTRPRPHPGSAQSPPEMTTSVKVVHMSVPCVYSGRRAPWSYPQRRAVSTRPARSATGAGGGHRHASGRTHRPGRAGAPPHHVVGRGSEVYSHPRGDGSLSPRRRQRRHR